MRCLVTGGAEFIGSHVVDALVDAGHCVAVLDNVSTGSIRNLEGKSHLICLHQADVTDLACVEAAAQKALAISSCRHPFGSTGTLHNAASFRKRPTTITPAFFARKTASCPGPNSDRIVSQINAVWILASCRPVCRIVENSGAGGRDGVGRVALRVADRLPHNTFTQPAIDLIVRAADGVLRKARNLCVGCLIEAVRAASKTIDIDNVNRVLLQPHWQKESDLADFGDW